MKLPFTTLVAILIALPATAQSYKDYKPISAKPGESCSGFYDGCVRWCDRSLARLCSTNSSGAISCSKSCNMQMAICRAEGRRPFNQKREVVVGLSVTRPQSKGRSGTSAPATDVPAAAKALPLLKSLGTILV